MYCWRANLSPWSRSSCIPSSGRRIHTSITAVYGLNKIVRLDASHASVKLLNASHAPKLFIQLDEPMRAQVKISNTCGEVVSEQRLVLQPGIVALDIPCSGLAELEIAR